MTQRSSGTVYFARWILTGADIIHEGAIRVCDGLITDVGGRTGIRQSGDRIVNLGASLLMPGMINLSTSLEESAIRHSYSSYYGSYYDLLNRVTADISQVSTKSLELSSRLALQESLSNGITTTVNTSSYLPCRDRINPLARLLTLVNVERYSDSSPQKLIDSLQKSFENRDCFGVSLPNIYTLAPKWIKEISRMSRAQKKFFKVHLAETIEEYEAYSEHSGSLYDKLQSEGCWHGDDSIRGSGWYAMQRSLLPHRAVIVNPLYCSTSELSALYAKRSTIAIAPRIVRYGGFLDFPLEAVLKRGIPVSVVTGTAALTPSLNLLDELFSIYQDYPKIPHLQLIKMVTEIPAKAIRMGDRLGLLQAGYEADIIGIQIDSLSRSPLEDALCGNSFIQTVIVKGEEVIVP